jgi:hypothetical protein
MPEWLHVVAMAFLTLGIVCALFIVWDVAHLPQRMAIMNVVWPVTALFGTVFIVAAYMRYGRLTTRHEHEQFEQPSLPFPVVVGKGALHCGAGCMIGDIVAEWLAFLVPSIALALGWHSVFREKMYAIWVLDFLFAFGLGIVFQYFAIVPMRKLSPGAGIVAAVKADALSLLSWQIGMYGFMAFAQFYVFQHLQGRHAEVDSVEFWFAMQLAMIAGFLTAYPVNWWLIRRGLKEKM